MRKSSSPRGWAWVLAPILVTLGAPASYADALAPLHTHAMHKDHNVQVRMGDAWQEALFDGIITTDAAGAETVRNATNDVKKAQAPAPEQVATVAVPSSATSATEIKSSGDPAPAVKPGSSSAADTKPAGVKSSGASGLVDKPSLAPISDAKPDSAAPIKREGPPATTSAVAPSPGIPAPKLPNKLSADSRLRQESPLRVKIRRQLTG